MIRLDAVMALREDQWDRFRSAIAGVAMVVGLYQQDGPGNGSANSHETGTKQVRDRYETETRRMSNTRCEPQERVRIAKPQWQPTGRKTIILLRY